MLCSFYGVQRFNPLVVPNMAIDNCRLELWGPDCIMGGSSSIVPSMKISR